MKFSLFKLIMYNNKIYVKNLLAIFVLVFASFSASFSSTLKAQAKLTLIEPEYSFGEIKEENGSVRHEFKIKNTGNEDLLITHVKASCGCTTPDWTKTPIAPGKTAFIIAEYNPKGRPGAFNKTLTVKSNDEKGTQHLFIKGTVIPKAWAIEDDFPMAQGYLRFKSTTLLLGSIVNNEKKTKVFEVYNQGDSAISFMEKQIMPSFANITFNPQKIPPKSKGILMVEYDASKREELGYAYDQIILLTDDHKQPQKKLSLLALISQYFPPMTAEEKQDAPRPVFDSITHDFKEITNDKWYSHKFKVTNNGKEPLKFLQIKSSCSCLKIENVPDEIPSGSQGEIKVSLDARGRRGTQVKTVDVFMNSPTDPKITLTLKAKMD